MMKTKIIGSIDTYNRLFVAVFFFVSSPSLGWAQSADALNGGIVDPLQEFTVKSHEFRGLSALNPGELASATKNFERSTIVPLMDIRDDRSLFITDPDRFGFEFYELMEVLAKRSGSGLGAAELFADWWREDAARCEVLRQEGHPRADGCETAERMLQHARITRQESDYVIRAIVNRGDLMSGDGESGECGEFRVIVEDRMSYLRDAETAAMLAQMRASGELTEADRVKTFLSFEFELVNQADGRQGNLRCVIVQRFFRNLTDQDDREAGMNLRKFAFGDETLFTADGDIVEPGNGEDGAAVAFGPVIHPDNLGGRKSGGGRIATNTLVHNVGKPGREGPQWRLRVYRFAPHERAKVSGNYKGARIIPALLPDSFDLRTEATTCTDNTPIFSPREKFFHKKAVFNDLGVNVPGSYCLAFEQTLESNFNSSFEIPRPDAHSSRSRTEVANLAKSDLNDPATKPDTGVSEQRLWSRIHMSSCSGCHGGLKIKEVVDIPTPVKGKEVVMETVEDLITILEPGRRMAKFTHTLDDPSQEPNAEAEATLSYLLRKNFLPWRCAIMNSVITGSLSGATLLQAVRIDTEMRNSEAASALKLCSAESYFLAERMTADRK